MFSNKYTVQEFEDFWNDLTNAQKEKINIYANTYKNNNSLMPSTQTFLNSLFDYVANNPSLNFDEIWYNRIDEINYTNSDYDNNTVGNYDETIYQQFNSQQNWSNISPIISPSNFIGWEYGSLKQDCMVYCKEQLKNSGYQISNYGATGQTFQIYKENTGVNTSQLNDGLSYLKYALSNGIPVVAGVDLKSGTSTNPGTDNTTDHFIVIVGMGQDSNGKYFRFYDNATGNQSLGTHVDNKLYYNSSTGKISGYSKAPYTKGLPYTITMIRKSKAL